MSSTQVAQALLHAYRDRFTGFVHVVSGDRTSRLGFREGDLVDAELRFGHQTAAQALLQWGRLDVLALDALWARGAGAAPDGALLEDLGLAADAVEPVRALACVRQLSAAGETAEFEAGDVEPRFHLPGARAVRAAFEGADDGEYAQRLYRCVDSVACAVWCESDEELELVSQLAWVETPPELDPSRRALLRVLALQGSIEQRDAAELSPPRASIALEIPPELPVLDGEPLTEDAEEDFEDYENVLIGGDDPEATEDLAAGGATEPGAEQTTTAATRSAWDADEPPMEKLPEWAMDAREEDLAAARLRAQDELAREMNEALRRAGAAPVETWLDDASEVR
ncbi:MAG TPA: hypothetical protein VE618_11970, partial [Myxococcaceae bacterium]|nr:hypothetical protein [Myxococcaceae bacterium]